MKKTIALAILIILIISIKILTDISEKQSSGSYKNRGTLVDFLPVDRENLLTLTVSAKAKGGFYELKLKKTNLVSGDIWLKSFQDPVDYTDSRYKKFWEITDSITFDAENNVVFIPVNKVENEILTARILTAIDYTGGTLLWQKEIPVGIKRKYLFCIPGKKYLYTYVVNQNDKAKLIALDSKTGDIKWEIFAPAIEPAIPFFHGGFLIFHSRQRKSMFSFDLKTGKMEEYPGIFPAIPWRESLVYYSLEKEGYSINTLSLQSGIAQKVYYERFPRSLPAIVYPYFFSIYRDKALFFYVTDEATTINAISLVSGKKEWSLLPEETSGPRYYNLSNSLLFSTPQYYSYFKIENPFLPLPMYGEKNDTSKLAIIDLEQGSRRIEKKKFGSFHSLYTYYHNGAIYLSDDESVTRVSGKDGNLDTKIYKIHFPDCKIREGRIFYPDNGSEINYRDFRE